MMITAAVGNPPYNLTIIDKNGKLQYPSIYHEFIELASRISTQGIMITPGRFLFATRTSKKNTPLNEWSTDMLDDEHFSVVKYYTDSKIVFPSVDIKGGVAITLYDNCASNGSPIGSGNFIPYDELATAKQKVVTSEGYEPLSEQIGRSGEYKLSDKLYEHLAETTGQSRSAVGSCIGTNTYSIIPTVFSDEPLSESTRIIMRVDGKRTARWIRNEYIAPPKNHNTYRVFLTEANKNGKFGETLSTPFVAGPGTGHSATFISIGSYSSREEANNCLKYLKTKFARAMLSTMRCTQHCGNVKNWINVPQQDYNALTSDIDWSATISGIDKQLYKKYGLTNEEKNFIEENSDPMS